MSVKTEKWIKETIADRVIQLNTITGKVITYKVILEISTPVIDRITRGNLMNKYTLECLASERGFSKSLTGYHDLLEFGASNALMNAFPVQTPFAVSPGLSEEGVWLFIGDQRAIWMKHKNWTEAIGDDMAVLGAHSVFNPTLYVPVLKAVASAKTIHVRTTTKNVTHHNLYARLAGTTVWIFIATFDGSFYDYERVLTVPNQAENVELRLIGVDHNKEFGKYSDTITVPFGG